MAENVYTAAQLNLVVTRRVWEYARKQNESVKSNVVDVAIGFVVVTLHRNACVEKHYAVQRRQMSSKIVLYLATFNHCNVLCLLMVDAIIPRDCIRPGNIARQPRLSRRSCNLQRHLRNVCPYQDGIRSSLRIHRALRTSCVSVGRHGQLASQF